MARITVEDCLEKENNRFALVRLASVRTKQIRRGSEALTKEGRSNKPVVAALREIAQGIVSFLSPEEEAEYRETLAQEERERQEAAEAAPIMNTTVIPFQGPPALRPVKRFDDEDEEESLPQLFGESTKPVSLNGDEPHSLNGKAHADDDGGSDELDD